MSHHTSASIPTVPVRGIRPSLKRVVQLLLVSLSSTAALVSVLNFAQEHLGDAGGRPAQLLAARSVAWVRTLPDADTARAIGDTVRLVASVAGRNGAALVAVPVLWTTSDDAVATVDARGQVVARGAGTATITAAAGEHVAQSRVVVRQAVASVVVVPTDSVLPLAEDESHALAVRASDRRGWPVAGRRAAWTVADTGVATVDSSGTVLGRRAGRTLLTASVEGAAFALPVVVRALPGALARAGDTTALRGPAGRALARRVAVRVLSRRGLPVEGATVRFAAAADGRVEPATVRTGANGVAAVAWTLGPMPGRQRLGASADGLDSTLDIVAEAEPVATNTRYVTVGDDLAGPVGEALGARVVVRLVDTAGRALPDVPVSWTPVQGRVADADARTDSLGEARAAWTLGTVAGRQRLVVQAGPASGVPPHVVTATARPGRAARLEAALDARAHAAPGDRVRVRLSVRDAYGNAVPEARVALAPEAGAVAPRVVVADAAGTARVAWTLAGRAGEQQLTMQVEGTEVRAVVAVQVAAPAHSAKRRRRA